MKIGDGTSFAAKVIYANARREMDLNIDLA
jgi:hypothetical protein